MKIRTLETQDAAALLDFEINNRDWFERYVLPRSDSVYSEEGMTAHIASCLQDYVNGTMHPCLIIDDDGHIAGRANLKDIDMAAGTTEIGYRIGEAYVGKGIATKAVLCLQDLAYRHWKLTRLFAFVTTENPASARVLEKCGFIQGDLISTKSILKTKILSCYQYQYVQN